MPAQIVPNPADLAEARERALLQAARETGAIASMLRRETADLAECADSQLLLPGTLMRIEALSAAIESLSGYGRDREADIAEQYAVVFGFPLEVASV